ncbi:MAG: peroxiredoxin family protein [Piscinibacter sp.]|nr:peroxiredoxin family protein [Piscinibacter sp.]
MPLLSNGDTFPELAIETVDGRRLVLPDALRGAFGVVLIYRGAWCPYCNAQLAGFARAAATFDELGIKVASLSVDDRATASALVEKLRLPFPVGHSADADQVAALTGAYVNRQPHHLQTTGFVLDRDGKVITAVYSSGAIGRLTAEDVAGFVRYVKSHG